MLQCRRDEGKARIVPVRAQRFVRDLAATGASSLLDHPEGRWARLSQQPCAATAGSIPSIPARTAARRQIQPCSRSLGSARLTVPARMPAPDRPWPTARLALLPVRDAFRGSSASPACRHFGSYTGLSCRQSGQLGATSKVSQLAAMSAHIAG